MICRVKLPKGFIRHCCNCPICKNARKPLIILEEGIPFTRGLLNHNKAVSSIFGIANIFKTHQTIQRKTRFHHDARIGKEAVAA